MKKERGKLFREEIKASVIQAIQTNVDLRDSKLIQNPQKLSEEITTRIEAIEKRKMKKSSDIGPIL